MMRGTALCLGLILSAALWIIAYVTTLWLMVGFFSAILILRFIAFPAMARARK